MSGEQIRHFSKANRREKQESEPGAAADVAGNAAEKEPRNSCHQEHAERRDAPGTVSGASPPGAGKYNKGRDEGDKKKDVVQVQNDEV